MQKTKKARTATILLAILWLLVGLSNISVAENIPISEEELEKIGLNKIRLESGIGVIMFNLSESSNHLKASGYLTVSNTYNTSITISCQIVTKLSTVDLNEDGTPRIHKTISNIIIFKPVPDGSWITLEKDNALVSPCSIYNFRYIVDIPLDEDTTFSADEGYLVYIHIKKTTENATGMQIGINYNYKLFLIFTGELEQGIVFSTWMLIPIPFVIGGILFITYKQKRRKDPFKIKDTGDSFEIKRTKPNVVKPDDNPLLHQKIDKLTDPDDQDVTWGGNK